MPIELRPNNQFYCTLTSVCTCSRGEDDFEKVLKLLLNTSIE